MFTRTVKAASNRFRSPRSHSRRQFAVERLESRLLLSADLLPEGVLQITGTDSKDTVLMEVFQPEEGTPQLAVTLNDETFQYDLEGIGEIQVDLKDGNDRLALKAVGVPLPKVVVDAGQGNDVVEAAVENDGEARHLLDLRVDLGEGNDTATTEITGSFDDLGINVSGGAGDDVVSLNIHDGTSNTIFSSIDLGYGDDVARSNVFAVWVTVGFFEVTDDQGHTTVGLNLTDVMPLDDDPLKTHKLAFQIISAGDSDIDASFVNTLLDIDFAAGTGSGDDTHSIKYTMFLADGTPVRSPKIDLDLTTGDGNDTVDIFGDFRGADLSATLDVTVDLGGGRDSARMEHANNLKQIGLGMHVIDPDFDLALDLAVAASDSPFDLQVEVADPLADHPDLYLNIWINQSELPSPSPDSLFDTFAQVSVGGAAEPGKSDENTTSWIRVISRPPSGSTNISLLAEALASNFSSLALHIQGSDGDDTISSGIIGFQDVNITTDAGAGNDIIVHEVVHTIQDSGGAMPSAQTRQITIIQDMGPGDDISDLVVRTDIGENGATAPLIERIVINGGDGNDAVAVGVHDGTSNTVFFGEVLPGAGNDTLGAVFDLLPPAAVITSPEESSTSGAQVTFEFTVDAGSDDDTVDVRVNNPAGLEFLLNIQAGDGNDTVLLDTIQQTSPKDIITGSGPAAGPHVKVFDGATVAETRSFFPYAPSFMGGVRVAAGDVNGDSIDDIITAAGPGGGPHVKVFDGSTGAEIRSFFAYDPTFTGGVFVAAGDINGDGLDDIITGSDAGAPGGHVKVFDGRTLGVLRSFFAYSSSFSGGVRVATGDVNGDGVPDIITGAGGGGAAHVKVFDGGLGTEIHSFFAYDPGFAGGVFVAAGDIDGDDAADIITGAGEGSPGGHVKVFRGTDLSLLNSFFAYTPTFRGGVRVAAGDVNNDGQPDIITGAGPGGGPHVKVFDGQSNALLRSFFAYDPAFKGGVYVAAGDINEHKPALKLALNAGDGDDTAVIESAARGGVSFEFFVDMGNGADQAIAKSKLEEYSLTYAIGGPRLDGAIHLVGGAGHDNLLSIFEASGGYRAGDRIRLQQEGGAGNDVLNTQWIGPALFGRSPSVVAGLDAGMGDDDVTFTVNGGFAALAAQILTGAGNDRADLRVQNPAAAEGGEDPESTDRARTRVPASLRVDMGTGADKVAVNWTDPLYDANVVLGASLEVVPGGAFNLPEVGDEVLVAFEHGDPNQPIIIGTLWSSQGSPPPDDDKSLSVTMINDGGRLDWSSQLKGGAGQDNMQLYFKGTLMVTGSPRTSPRLRAEFDLGAGNDAALIDVSELVVEGTGDPAPIRVNALGGAGEDTLQFNGNGAPIRLTDDAIIQKGVARVVHAGFETVSVEKLFVLSWEDLKRLSDLYGSDEVLTGTTM